MADFQDFHAFKNTSSGKSSGGGRGCLNGILLLFVVLGCLWLVGQLFI